MHTKDEIDQWLKSTGKTRQWLADQCGVKYLVVNNWFSKSRNIPKKALIIIDKLMTQTQTPTTMEVSVPKFDITLKVTPEKFVEFSNYAKSCGMSIVDWIIYVLEFAGDNKGLLLKRLQEGESHNPPENAESSRTTEDTDEYGKPAK